MPLQPKQQAPYYTPGTGTTQIYKAICTQTGTNAPIPNVLQNTITIPDLTWYYDAQGSFSFGAFPENLKIFVQITANSSVARIINAGDDGNQYVVVKNNDASGTTVNDIIFNITIEIHP